ncbi:ATP-dependent protease [Thalassotalea sp. HSM 43]|uniref:Lon protease family protein n=1 Tax=Thalassotalea sp. HSM 43 TaxID=2552945 RepID=UPI0010806D72|nr:ATP-binding protein [Thalassotalea sp. HSM 43]QBY05499.1 ATP-dependent protease [Thalassotalea sp. HSM 43]
MTATTDALQVPVEQLTAALPAQLFTQSVVDDKVKQKFIGHDRAKEALNFGLSMTSNGFNVFAKGEPGTGRQTLISQMLAEFASNEDTADEWCYINNFDDPQAPHKLYLNAGEGKQLQAKINDLLDDLLDLFPEIFDNPGYQRQRAAIDREFNKRYDSAIEELEEYAYSKDVVLYEEKGEISFSPLVDGKPLGDKEFANLDEKTRTAFYHLLEELETMLSEKLLELPLWKRESSVALRKLKFDTAEQSIRPLLKELEHEFTANLGVLKYLRQVKDHITEVVLDILVDENSDNPRDDKACRKLLVERFMPNLLVARESNDGAPVVYEQNPTFQNLFGTLDYSSIQGAVYTNYRLIRAGAMHKANGGYLLLDAEKLLSQPMVWQRLKLALKTGEIQIEHPYAEMSIGGSVSLEPEKIPLKVKVVLLGNAEIYYTLQEYDQEFTELFRVLADFDRHVDKSDENLRSYATLIRQHAAKHDYPYVDDEAVSLLVRYSLRKAEHQNKLSANIVNINDLLDEAVFIWRMDDQETIQASHVEAALTAKKRRSGRLSETWLQEIKEEQVLISTEGAAVGNVNGLTVLEIGDSVFGTPARISATVYAGAQGVTDIEREAELGKSIHSKGVLLLIGYLGHKYGQSFPLSISANIAIEQSYGHIDGDSASMAELCALISSITGLPIKQEIAITGSMNQHGGVQSIGGVNEKIEGFYRLCKDKGLTGNQGVIIPKTNMMNLMLDQDVIDAVQQGHFAIYAVDNVDQALEILLDEKAGTAKRDGSYPKKSIHGQALTRLKTLSDLLNGSDD